MEFDLIGLRIFSVQRNLYFVPSIFGRFLLCDRMDASLEPFLPWSWALGWLFVPSFPSCWQVCLASMGFGLIWCPIWVFVLLSAFGLLPTPQLNCTEQSPSTFWNPIRADCSSECFLLRGHPCEMLFKTRLCIHWHTYRKPYPLTPCRRLTAAA